VTADQVYRAAAIVLMLWTIILFGPFPVALGVMAWARTAGFHINEAWQLGMLGRVVFRAIWWLPFAAVAATVMVVARARHSNG
jgi:hypothetical protein